jgi:hypothetical protein
MAMNPAELERPIVYDFDDICSRVDNPIKGARDVREDMVQQLERMFDSESYHDEDEAALAVGEITKDVVVYGDESETRVVFLQPMIDGVSLHSFDIKGAETPLAETDPDCHTFGEQILKKMYRQDYISIIDGDVFERHLFIRGDIDLQLPRIRHND